MAPRESDKRSSQNGGNEYAGITVAVNTSMGEDRRETEYIAVNLYGNPMQSAMVRATPGHPVQFGGRMSHRWYQRQDGGRGRGLRGHDRDFRIPHRAPEGDRQPSPGQDEFPGQHAGQNKDLDINDPSERTSSSAPNHKVTP